MKYLTVSYTTKDPVTAGGREGWKCLEAGYSEQPKMKHMARTNREITMATHVPKMAYGWPNVTRAVICT